MATENVNIKVTQDMADAIAGWKEIASGPLALENALKKLADQEGKTSKGWARELDRVAGKWTSIGFLINQAQSALKAFLSDARRMREESFDVTEKIDTGLRTYQIAAGIPDEATANLALDRISQVVQRAKARPEQGFAGAALLAQFGATREEQTGDALFELLELQSAADISGGKMDAAALSRSVLEILKRSDKPITGKSVRSLGGAAMQLSQAGIGFGATQMDEFAGVATVAKDAGLDYPTALAMWASLRESYDPKEAKSRFKALHDKRPLPGEAQQRRALEGRAGDLLEGGGLSYEEIQEISTESMAAKGQLGKTQYELSGRTPGMVSTAKARENLITLIRQSQGESGTAAEFLYGQQFDVLTLWGAIGPEWAAKQAAGQQGGGPEAIAQRYRQIIGQEAIPVSIRLTGPDGRDIPFETQAADLNAPIPTSIPGGR